MNNVDNCFVKNMVDSDRYQKEIKNIKELNKSHCFMLWFESGISPHRLVIQMLVSPLMVCLGRFQKLKR